MTSRGLIVVLVYLVATLLRALGPARAQEAAAGERGTVAGQVIDAATGEPIIEAGVEVVGTGRVVRTDIDGRYAIKLPPGTYQLRFFAPLYQGVRLERVTVQGAKVTTGDVPLKPTGQAGVEVVEVVAQAAKAAEATQLVKRQQAPVVSDNIGAETIKKAPDADAAEVVQRVPAVTVKDEKFIFVRGLGERYSSALLNGSRLPSPDPERRVVPLDLFPADFLESISIVKGYTPDLPGDFSGGLANIELLDFPQQLTYGLGASIAGNSNTTFKRFKTYPGETADYFGLGDGKRALPDIIPDRSISGDSAAVRQEYGRSFDVIWDTETVTAPIDFSVGGQAGNRWGPFGARIAFTYSTKYRARDQRERQFLQAGSFEDPNPVVADDFLFNRNVFETRLGAVLTSAYELSRDHRFTLRALVDRNSTDETTIGDGTTEQTGIPSRSTQLQYTRDQLGYGQLAGEHHAGFFDVDWRTALSQTTQNIPDWRITNRLLQDGEYVFSDQGFGGSRIFSDLSEWLSDSAVDVSVPFDLGRIFPGIDAPLPAKLKFGPAYAYRDRESDLRVFRLVAVNPALADLAAPFDTIFRKRNIGGGQQNLPFAFTENTQPQNAFAATQEIIAGYGMIELPLLRDRLRFIGGVRTEYSYIQLDIFDQTGAPAKVIKNDLDPLPAANLVYTPRPDMNLRLGYSQTTSRPEFRELSPAVYPAPRGLRGLVGNPFLVSTSIDNYDLRWEWFLGPTELVSASFFYKKIAAPIEQAVRISGSAPQDTFQQNRNGKLFGFEVEARKNLGFLASALRDANFLTNFTYVESEVTALVRPGADGTPPLSRTRDLQGQAPYVVNAALEYEHPTYGTARLLYNTIGPTIARVQDRTALPDFIEERRDQLDFVYLAKVNAYGTPLSLKLSVENLLNDNYLTTVGGTVQEDYRTGVTVSLGASYLF